MNTEDMERMINATLDLGEDVKRQLVEAAKPTDPPEMTDITPVLGYLMDGEEQIEGVPPSAFHTAYEMADGDMAGAIMLLIHAIRHDIVPDKRVRMIIFGHEAWHAHGDDYDKAIERWGSLSKAYKYDPSLDVHEALVCCIAADDLVGGYETMTGIRPFRIDDGQQIRFEPTIFGDANATGGGRIEAAMLAALLKECDHD